LPKFRSFAKESRQSAATNQLHEHLLCVSHVVPLLRFCALGSGVDFVAQQRVGKIKFWSWDYISARGPSQRPIPGAEIVFNSGHGTIFPKTLCNHTTEVLKMRRFMIGYLAWVNEIRVDSKNM